MTTAISKNIKDLQEELKTNPQTLLLVVTKAVQIEEILECYSLGVRDFGENKVQTLMEKYNKLQEKEIRDINWHFIGNLQRNKVKYIAPFIHLIHSVNRLSLAKEIDKQARKHNRTIDILLEINISCDPNKEGYLADDLPYDLKEILTLENIRVRGLMAMATHTTDERIIRKDFKGLKALLNNLNDKFFSTSPLDMLSMGMSGDYKIAIEEGSTIIRVGSKIFK